MAHRPSHRDLAGLLTTSTLTTSSPLPPGVSVVIDTGENAERLYVHGTHGTIAWTLRDDRAARRWGRIDSAWHALRLPGTWACDRYDRALGVAAPRTTT